ncbi:hypothetical protein N7G274_003173 [Stereocaulon virgatum]|uniref:Uncharacterized protein n=1 Tax=Stereocaulon virgatum TaxID=373712 RepID=A0ABR4AM06_9LECA
MLDDALIDFGPQNLSCLSLQNKTAIDDCQREEDHALMVFFLVISLGGPAFFVVLWAFELCCAYLDEIFGGGKVETGDDEEDGVDEKTALLGNEKV